MKLHQGDNSKLTKSRLRVSRAGFSLLEIIIVTTLMVIVAAMTVPSMGNFLTAQKLEKGAERVRTEMASARVKAIRSGQIYAFMFRPQMTTFTVVPFNDAFQESMFVGQEQVGGLDNRPSQFSFDLNRLPEGTVFAAANTQNDPRGAQAFADNDVSVSEMQPILFYPDGSSQNAVVILQNERNQKMKITLRGLTGKTTSQTLLDE